MANRHVLDGFWDRKNVNGVNNNFVFLFAQINDLLKNVSNIGNDLNTKTQIYEDNFKYLFESVEKTLQISSDAEQAIQQAQAVNAENKSVQSQINQLIIDNGQSDAEVTQARVDINGVASDTLKARIDKVQTGVIDASQKSALYDKVYGTPTTLKLPYELGFLLPFNLQTALNGTVKADYNVTNKKNKVVSRYYVDVKNGNNDNDGSENKPFQTLNRAFRYDPVDEIVIKSGIYGWSNGEGGTSVRWENASFNLIGDGEVYLGAHREGQQWTPVPDKNNVYSTVASAVIEIIDLNDGYESPIFYKKMNSIEDVEKNKSSYFIGSGNTIYVNPKHTGTPNEKILLNMWNNALKLNDKNKVYLENINFTNTLLVENSTPGELYAKNCKFAYGTSDNAVSIKGDVYFELQNCNSMWATLDGFNYHIHNGKLPKGIELDCKSFNNGRDGADQNNGSTMHDGGKILRIGGEYYSNQGPNVIDVNEGTLSVNVGVHSHSSRATSGTISNSNFKNGNVGTSKMYLYNCVSNNSDYSVVTATTEGSITSVENSLLIEPETTY